MSEETGTTILGEDVNAQVATTQESLTVDQQKAFLEQLVGEGKKYSDPEALAKSYVEADKFIGTLKTEKRELETELQELRTRANVEDQLLDSLRSINPGSETSAEETTVKTDDNQMTPEVIAELVEQTLANREQKSEVKKASELAWGKLAEKFGSLAIAKEKVRSYVDGNKTRAQALELLGRTDPEEFVDFIFRKTKAADTGVESSDGRGFQTSDGDVGKLTWKKALEIKKDNPEEFKSRKFQVELHKAAEANPNFFNT